MALVRDTYFALYRVDTFFHVIFLLDLLQEVLLT